MRKIISVIYLLCFFSFFNTTSAQVVFTASSPNPNCDDATFCVEISVSDFDSITSFQHVYEWDTTIMQILSFTDFMPATGLGIPPNPDSMNVGRAPYSWLTFLTSENLADGFVVAEFCFNVNNNGTGDMAFTGSNTTLQRVDGIVNGTNTENIPAIYNNGNIVFQDTENPLITCPNDTTIMSNGTMVGDIAPVSFSDNCEIDSVDYVMTMGGMNIGSGLDDASGESFNLGTTNVMYTVTDSAGNAASCSFDVTLLPPPPDTGALQFIPEINFDCDAGTVSINMLVMNFDSITGMQFGMEWDGAVLDYTGNTINLPALASLNLAPSGNQILHLFAPLATSSHSLPDNSVIFTLNFDLIGTFTTPVLDIISFPGIDIGVGQIQDGVDVNLVQDVDFFFLPEVINVIDNTAPMITGCPSDINVTSDPGLCETNVSWTIPTITDNCSIDTIIVSDVPGVFPVGVDTVTYTVIDIGGNSETCSFIITVSDNENPVISCPGSVTVDATFGTCANSTVNIGTATATDNCAIASISHDAPASFPVGSTTVTWTATDVNGNSATCTQIVTIVDNELPTISCPANINDCPNASISLGIPSTSDNCGVASVTNNAPSSYPIGVTTVTWTVTDNNGNTATCMQTVTIEDNIVPMITCPNTDAIDAPIGTCSAVYSNNLSPIVSDNCDMDLTVTFTVTGATSIMNGMNDATGETFNVGTSTLTYYVTDDVGNIDSCSATIQINDNELPVLDCPNNTTVFVPSGTVDTMLTGLNLSASDNCGVASTTFGYSGDLTGTGIGDDASITFFPPGTTTVTYYVTDVNGNIDSCSFDVNVQIVSSDLIGCQPDQIESNDTDSCNAVVNGIAPTILVAPGDIASITYTLSGQTTGSGINDASGQIFNVGTTTLQYIATDNFGNMDTCSLDITVNDTQLPVWTNCPTNITTSVNVMNSCTAVVNWTAPTGSDNCGIDVTIISHNPGDVFPIGTTTVSYVAFDAAGNVGTCSFTVTVEDNTAPVPNCPSDITVNAASGVCDAVATWSAVTGTDDCSAVTVSCTAMSGDVFPVGTTTVVCTLSDTNNNSSTCSFDVTVLDNTAPDPQNCPADIDVAPNFIDCQAIVTWVEPTFMDCPPVTVTSTHEPGDTFSLGTTTVIYLAIDPAGNDTTCTFDINVIDDEAPVVTCPSDITVNSISNDCGAFVNWPMPTATDNCDANVSISQVPPPGTFFPVGTSMVTVTATDDAGNSSTCNFNIDVIDVFAPEFTCPPQDITINMDGTIEGDVFGIISNVDPIEPVCNMLTVNYSAPASTDNCNVASVNLTSGIDSGDPFPVGTTTLIFTALDDAGNFDMCEFNIVVVPLDDIGVAIQPADVVCEGEDITLITNGNTPGATFNWTGPNGFTSMDSSPVNPDVTTLDAGTYFVTITYVGGCTATGMDVLTVNPADPVIASSNAPICTGEDIELHVELPVGVNVDSIRWSGPNGFTGDLEDEIITNPSTANVGVYDVIVYYEGGCFATSSTSVTITLLPSPTIDLDCISDICLGSSCLLTGTQYVPAPDFYNWEAIQAEGAGLPANTDNNQITITPTLPGTYIYNYSVELNGCESEQASQVITVHGAPDAVEDIFEIPYETQQDIQVIGNDTFNANIGINISIVSTTTNGTLVNNGDGTFSYTPNSGYIGTDQFIYEICYDCGPLLCDNVVVTLNVTDDRECVFPTVITPNKDGLNDELFINCLEGGGFPNNEIIIYNQWGDEVFTAAPYQNNWAGTYEGNDLPDGTYYVVFKLDNNAELVKQFITIFR